MNLMLTGKSHCMNLKKIILRNFLSYAGESTGKKLTVLNLFDIDGSYTHVRTLQATHRSVAGVQPP
jgi:hypothetical protein